MGVQRLAREMRADHREAGLGLEQAGDRGEPVVGERRADQHHAEREPVDLARGNGHRGQVEEIGGVGEAAQPGVGAQRVGGDNVHVTNLTQPGKEPHDLELDIKTTAEVSDADLVLLEHGFQPAVDDAVAEVAEGEVLDVADVVDLKDSTEDAGE